MNLDHAYQSKFKEGLADVEQRVGLSGKGFVVVHVFYQADNLIPVANLHAGSANEDAGCAPKLRFFRRKLSRDDHVAPGDAVIADESGAVEIVRVGRSGECDGRGA